MSRLNPTQHWENLLVPVKGYIEGYALDFSAALADKDDDFKAGTLCHLDSDGKIARGCGDAQMPVWAIYNADQPSVQGDYGNVEGGGMTVLVATGGFEVYSTAYDKTQTYSPNDLLTAGTGDDSGLVTKSPAAYNTRLICGAVSQGERTGVEKAGHIPQYGQDLLYFWTMFIPKVKTS